jgi:hypothetical protein
LLTKLKTLGYGKVSEERLAAIAAALSDGIPSAAHFEAALRK